MLLSEINSKPKNGNENFSLNTKNLNFQLSDFWIWNQSNLIENRTRGILAEFIVKKALDIKNETRIEWDSYDLITDDGFKIEIKSAAYIQSWNQSKFSKINFSNLKKILKKIKKSKKIQEKILIKCQVCWRFKN